MMADSNIDYSASRKKSVMAVKKIRQEEERLSQILQKQRQSVKVPGHSSMDANFPQRNYSLVSKKGQAMGSPGKSPFGDL